MLRQRADIAPRLVAGFVGEDHRLVRRVVVVCSRWRHVRHDIRKIERKLIGGDHSGLLRSRAEHHILERCNDGPQMLILGVERKHHLGQPSCVAGKIFETKRHP